MATDRLSLRMKICRGCLKPLPPQPILLPCYRATVHSSVINVPQNPEIIHGPCAIASEGVKRGQWPPEAHQSRLQRGEQSENGEKEKRESVE